MSTVRNLSDDLDVTDLNGFTDVDVYIRVKDKSSGHVYNAIRYTRTNMDIILDFLKGRVVGTDPRLGTIYYRPSLRSLDRLAVHRQDYIMQRVGTNELFTEDSRWIWSRFDRC